MVSFKGIYEGSILWDFLQTSGLDVTNQAWLVHTWFLEIDFVYNVCCKTKLLLYKPLFSLNSELIKTAVHK